MRRRIGILSCLWLNACVLMHPAQPIGDQVKAVLSVYAPEVGLGHAVTETLQQLPELKPASYVGYESSEYLGPDGFSHLMVGVENKPFWAASEGSRPPTYHRVTSIQLSAATVQSAEQAERRLTGLLGKSNETCWREYWGGLNRWLSWTDKQGGAVWLKVPVGPWKFRSKDATGERVELRVATLTITTEVEPKSSDRYPSCDEAPQPDAWRFSVDPA